MVSFTSSTETGETPGVRGRLRRIHSDTSRLEYALWGVVLLAMALDIALTAYGLSIGLVERNPIVRVVIDSFGIAVMAVVKLIALAIGVGFRLAVPRYGLVAPAGLAVPWVVAVINNAALILAVQT